MNKILIVFLLTLPYLVSSQNMDTIITRYGERIACTIDEIKDNNVDYTREVGKKFFIESMSLLNVKKYILGAKSAIESGMAYNSDIEEKPEPTNDYIFEGIVNTDSSRKAQALFEIAKKWFAIPTTDITKHIDYEDPESGQIIGKCTTKFMSKSLTSYSLECAGVISFDVNISVKDGKYRYTFENFIHVGNLSAPFGPLSYGKITNADGCPYKLRNYDEEWNNARWIEIKDLIDQKTTVLIQELKNLMNNPLKNNDW